MGLIKEGIMMSVRKNIQILRLLLGLWLPFLQISLVVITSVTFGDSALAFIPLCVLLAVFSLGFLFDFNGVRVGEDLDYDFPLLSTIVWWVNKSMIWGKVFLFIGAVIWGLALFIRS